jgi:asparagine synthase (glutamine-hydrolysing)
MCGIAGMVNLKGNSVNPEIICRITDAMSHRGPDADGFHIDNHVALGHRRLSIIDLSTVANQPMSDYTGRYWLIFNGEIYNFKEVKSKLPEYPYQTQGDSEVILAAYSKWGANCLKHFAGMFSFAIWDKQDQSLFIARDRLGVKPLYYFFNDEVFVFASEIRALLKSGLIPRRIEPKAIHEFFHYQSVSHPYTIIKDIIQLEAGCFMTISEGRIDVKKYWDITENKIDFDFTDKANVQLQLRHLLQQSVQRRMVSDVPLGAFLSGGIDSSAVVGLMAETSNSPVNTFTIGFEEKEFDESAYADIIAKKFNTRHTTVTLNPKVFLEELHNALNSMDTPSGDGVNTYVVSKEIKNSGLTVALSGVGGDELFAGYPFFNRYLQLRKWKTLWERSNPLRSLGSHFLTANNSVQKDRLKQLLQAEGCSIAEFYPVFRQILSPSMISKVSVELTRQQTSVETKLKAEHIAIEHFPLLSQVSIAEYLGYTQHTLLKDTDQMSMAVSLEVREPYFDHELIEFVLNIPDSFKKPTYPKSFLVESLGSLLPGEIVHRKKQGFLFPWSLWMKNELHSFCEERIQHLCERDFIRPDAVRSNWKRFLDGDRSVRWMELWLFVILEYWLEKNGIDN